MENHRDECLELIEKWYKSASQYRLKNAFSNYLKQFIPKSPQKQKKSPSKTAKTP
ncbi:hypothetical protein HpHNI55_07970 [Helicobacter pylori]